MKNISSPFSIQPNSDHVYFVKEHPIRLTFSYKICDWFILAVNSQIRLLKQLWNEIDHN